MHCRRRCLELHTTKGTRWQPLGQAANLSHVLQLPYALPRRLLKLADIPSALPPPLLARFVLPSTAANPHAHGHQQHQAQQAAALPGPNDPEALSCFFEFDFVGCVVRVGEAMGAAEGGGWRQQQAQWVFLADPTSGLCGAGGAAGPQPWLLAVKLVGAPVSGLRGLYGEVGRVAVLGLCGAKRSALRFATGLVTVRKCCNSAGFGIRTVCRCSHQSTHRPVTHGTRAEPLCVRCVCLVPRAGAGRLHSHPGFTPTNTLILRVTFHTPFHHA